MSKLTYLDDTFVQTESMVSINHNKSPYVVNMRKVEDRKIFMKATANSDDLVNVVHAAMTADQESATDALLASPGKASVNVKDVHTGSIKTSVLPRLALVPKIKHVLPNGMLIKFYGVPDDLGTVELS